MFSKYKTASELLPGVAALFCGLIWKLKGLKIRRRSASTTRTEAGRTYFISFSLAGSGEGNSGGGAGEGVAAVGMAGCGAERGVKGGAAEVETAAGGSTAIGVLA